MKLKISEILKGQGLFGNEIRTRFRNGQITLNNEVTKDIEVEFKSTMIDGKEVLNVTELGEFIFFMINDGCPQDWITALSVCGIESLVEGTNVKTDLTKHLSKFAIIRMSKKDAIVLEKG